MKMNGLPLLLILTMAPLITCYCPPKKMNALGHCAFHIHCEGKIRGVSLPPICQGSTNYPVTVDLVLTNAVERFDDYIDEEFLTTITSFKASGYWPQTNLSMLEYMPRLQNLYLTDNKINEIIGSPFIHLNRLENLDLSYNNLTHLEDVFEFETYPNKMRKLLLAHNAISEIPGDAFSELSSLVELDLSYNHISDLTEMPFYNLTTLKLLKLNNNKIKDLNGAVNNLHNLKHLFLRGNQIQNINTESLKIIYDLETFDISWNQLENLKPAVFSRHWHHFGTNSVCKIDLSENQITFVPNATSKEIYDRFIRSFLRGRHFHNVDVFTELDLSKNAISNIEYDAFQPLVQLVSLDLSKNKLINFVVNARDMANVKYLNLSSNYINNLYFDSFRSMNSLQNLDLSHNNLYNIPDQTFTNNYNLKYVNMTNNYIEMIDNLRIQRFHPEGGVLDLSKNSISKLCIFGEGSRLTMLILQYNNITDVSMINLYYLKELETLDMSGNFIQELQNDFFKLPVNLLSLDLSYNHIEIIGLASFKNMGNLKTLRIAHNNITLLEYGTFQGLTNLLNLDLSFNNIAYLDSKVMMDLKSLKVISLRFNGLYYIDYKGWLGHMFDLTVYLEGSNLSCDWLAAALNDFNNGYSRMRPSVLVSSSAGNSLEGIPCVTNVNKEFEEGARLRADSDVADERLLVITRKILEAIKEQNFYMERYIRSSKTFNEKQIN